MPDMEPNVLFTVQPVPGKGNGVIAASKIRKGTRIHTELPLITLPRVDEAPSVKILNEVVVKQLRSATRDQQRTFFSLTNIYGKKLPIPLGIVQTNALAYGPGGEGGVFLTASQFNHNCLPNAGSKWNDELGKMTVHALRDIEPGKEITVTYINLDTRNVRQKTLQDAFQFTCSCEMCTLPQDVGKGMDASIMEIKEIETYLKSNSPPLELGLRLAYRQRYLIESNGLDRTHAPDTYEFASQLTAVYKDYARASILCKRQLAIAMTEGGPEHPDTQKQRAMDMYLGNILEHHLGPAVPYHFSRIMFEDWLWMQHLPEVEEEGSGVVDEQDNADGNSDDSSSDEVENMGFDVETLG